MFYIFKRARQPDGDVSAYALQFWRAMAVSAYPGVCAGSLNVLQPPQVLHRHMAPTVGLGGTFHGQWFSGPLRPKNKGSLLSTQYDPETDAGV